MRRLAILILAAAALAATPAGAETPRIDMGITSVELDRFLARDGWASEAAAQASGVARVAGPGF